MCKVESATVALMQLETHLQEWVLPAMSCRHFLLRLGCKGTADKTACGQMKLSSLYELAVFAAVLQLLLPGTEIANAQESGPNRGVQAEPVSPGTNLPEKVGRAVSQPDRADGTTAFMLGREHRPLYRLSKSDVLEVSFAFASEFNQTVTVQPDGYVTLKDAGHLFAEGLTAQDLETAIAAAYSRLLHDPKVTVNLKEFDRPYFIVSGEVTRPGKYELRGDTTITAALAIAGGLTQQSKHSQVVLFRRVTPSLVETRVLNVKAMLKRRDLSEDPLLQAGDSLFVPRSMVSNIMRFMPATNMGMYTNTPKF